MDCSLKTGFGNVQVVPHIGQLLLQGDKRLVDREGLPEIAGQRQDRLLSPLWAGTAQSGDGAQGVEEEMRIELAEQQYLALFIAQKCLPFLREGMENDAAGQGGKAGRVIKDAVDTLLISKPFSAAVDLEKVILFPKIVVNSLGLVLFMGRHTVRGSSRPPDPQPGC